MFDEHSLKWLGKVYIMDASRLAKKVMDSVFRDSPEHTRTIPRTTRFYLRKNLSQFGVSDSWMDGESEQP